MGRDAFWKVWTKAQRKLLERAADCKRNGEQRDSVYVSGEETEVAHQLARRGYGSVGDAGYVRTFAVSEQGLLATR